MADAKVKKTILKPCPFCGGEASVYVADGGACVRCNKCGVMTRHRVDTTAYRKPTNAVGSVMRDWNRRASDG